MYRHRSPAASTAAIALSTLRIHLLGWPSPNQALKAKTAQRISENPAKPSNRTHSNFVILKRGMALILPEDGDEH